MHETFGAVIEGTGMGVYSVSQQKQNDIVYELLRIIVRRASIFSVPRLATALDLKKRSGQEPHTLQTVQASHVNVKVYTFGLDIYPFGTRS